MFQIGTQSGEAWELCHADHHNVAMAIYEFYTCVKAGRLCECLVLVPLTVLG